RQQGGDSPRWDAIAGETKRVSAVEGVVVDTDSERPEPILVTSSFHDRPVRTHYSLLGGDILRKSSPRVSCTLVKFFTSGCSCLGMIRETGDAPASLVD